jgi:hypothetical protein
VATLHNAHTLRVRCYAQLGRFDRLRLDVKRKHLALRQRFSKDQGVMPIAARHVDGGVGRT